MKDFLGIEMEQKTESDHIAEAREKLLDAVLPHVAFDGWTSETLRAAVAESDVEASLAHLAFPRGGVDMALAFHYRADQQLADELNDTDAAANLASLRIRERIAYAVRRRIEIVADEREAVRRGATLLGLPIYAAEGMKAIWNTADVIWNACGDTSDDYNWYTKRAILSSVYSATVLFWLGDQSTSFEKTWDFLSRRIENVMQFEKTKAMVQKNPLFQAAMWGPNQVLSRVKPPSPRV
ncbi:MAG: COQ9 family protein [Pseudomonadota bacterium]